MSQPIILEGDLTTTGGRMIPSQTARKSNGKNIIVLGDKFFCPACKAMGAVIQASDLQFCNSVGVAYHGCKVKCGCPGNHIVMATQSVDLVDKGSSGKSTKSNTNHVIAQSLVSDKTYEHQFVLVDEFTQIPLADRFYKIIMDGVTVTGKTDSQGQTQLMTASEMLEVLIEVYPENYEEPSK
ncbi:PAAR domain-containing protein [Acinetobacter guillouiae]|jgi:uncharacterized Zn-binding protein involved in type VI secretion|uniref:PAAR domain-containing protein n=1 Tax=Acinetobacter guillouiae TaxID=106649 RepID=UPI003AF6E1D8